MPFYNTAPKMINYLMHKNRVRSKRVDETAPWEIITTMRSINKRQPSCQKYSNHLRFPDCRSIIHPGYSGVSLLTSFSFSNSSAANSTSVDWRLSVS